MLRSNRPTVYVAAVIALGGAVGVALQPAQTSHALAAATNPPDCPVDLAVHSALLSKEIVGGGLVRTADGTVLVRVRSAAAAAYKGWTVGDSAIGALAKPNAVPRNGRLAVIHAFADGGGIDTERIDVSKTPATVYIGLAGGATCSPVPVKFARIDLTAENNAGTTAVLERGHAWERGGIGGVALPDQLQLLDTIAAFDGAELRLSGHLRLNDHFRSRNLIDIVTDGTKRFDIAPGQGATFTIPPRANSTWLEPDLVVTALPYRADAQHQAVCMGSAKITLPANIWIGDPKQHERVLAPTCGRGTITGFSWEPEKSEGPWFVGWTTGHNNQGGSATLRLCPRLDKIVITLAGHRQGNELTYLDAEGKFNTIRTGEPDATCLSKATRRHSSTHGFDDDGAPQIREVGLLPTFGSIVPVARLVGTERVIDRRFGFSACTMEAVFAEDRVDAIFSGVLDAQLFPQLTPFARRQEKEKSTGQKSGPTPQPTSTPTGFPPPKKSRCTQVADATAVQKKRVDDDPDPARPSMVVNVSNVKASIKSEDVADFANPLVWRDWSFKDATIDTGKRRSLFGHAVAPCSDAAKDAKETRVNLAENTLCVGLHLSPHNSSDTDPDIAFGLARLCADFDAETHRNDHAKFACPKSVNPDAIAVDQDTMAVVGFTAQLPTKEPARIRLGVGSLLLSGLEVGMLSDSKSFEEAIGSDRLDYMGCQNLTFYGSAALGSIDTSGSALSVAAALTATKPTIQTAIVSDPTLFSTFTAVPTFAMGGRCSIFTLQGILPVQLTPQSSVVITSLILSASKDDDDSDLFYANAAGTITSGNITAVFRSIGFRTMSKRKIGDSLDGCDHRAAKDSQARRNSTNHHETRLGNLCVVSDINWPLTSAITAARNSGAITQAITGLGGALFGIAVSHH